MLRLPLGLGWVCETLSWSLVSHKSSNRFEVGGLGESTLQSCHKEPSRRSVASPREVHFYEAAGHASAPARICATAKRRSPVFNTQAHIPRRLAKASLRLEYQGPDTHNKRVIVPGHPGCRRATIRNLSFQLWSAFRCHLGASSGTLAPPRILFQA